MHADESTPEHVVSAPPTEAAWTTLLADSDPWLSKREAAAFRGVSTSTLDRMVKAGIFPKPEAVSPGRRGWRLSVVRDAEAAPFTPKGGMEPHRVHAERTASAGKLPRKADGGRA
jgi:predicted DNA-binding transcriptional regulator AlpA